MKTIYKYLILFFIFVCSSCENEIPFNVENSSPKLILNALLEAGRETNYISIGLTGRDSASFVDNAKIDIYINNELKEVITETCLPDDSVYYKMKAYKMTARFFPGDLVKVEVRTDDGKYYAWAEDFVPEVINIEKIDTFLFIGKRPDLDIDYAYLHLMMPFTDNPDKRNFYRLTVTENTSFYGISEFTAKDSVYVYEYHHNLYNQEDIVLNDGRLPNDDNNRPFPEAKNWFNVFNDSYLNGTYDMRINLGMLSWYYMPLHMDVKRIATKVKVRLISITETEFFYLKALNSYASSDFDFFLTQPVLFPGNVHGGVGILGFEADCNQTISLPDYCLEENI